MKHGRSESRRQRRETICDIPVTRYSTPSLRMEQTDKGREKGDQDKERGRGETMGNGGTGSRRDSTTAGKEGQNKI